MPWSGPNGSPFQARSTHGTLCRPSIEVGDGQWSNTSRVSVNMEDSEEQIKLPSRWPKWSRWQKVTAGVGVFLVLVVVGHIGLKKREKHLSGWRTVHVTIQVDARKSGGGTWDAVGDPDIALCISDGNHSPPHGPSSPILASSMTKKLTPGGIARRSARDERDDEHCAKDPR